MPSEIFWRMRWRSVFCHLGFTRSMRPRNLKSFSTILTRWRLRRTIYREKNQRTGGEVMQAIKGNRAWPSWLLRVPPGQRKADEGWPVGDRNRCSVCRSWHYVQHDAMGSLHVGQKSWETKILRREVLSVVGNSTFATPETLARMPYLKAWLRETLRLYPVLSAIPRRPKDDIILGGYHIPGGTAQVEFLVHQMGRDENFWRCRSV